MSNATLTPTIATLLKYADLQMAAEAFLVEAVSGDLKSDLKQALIVGNDRSSKFTEPQAVRFLEDWEVIAQQSNTGTGFSGTVFKSRKNDPSTGTKVGDVVLSFRSTEFVDDYARDNAATNALEIKETRKPGVEAGGQVLNLNPPSPKPTA